MEGLAALGVCVVLRRLATVVFPVVAHDPHSPDPCLVIRIGSVLVGLRCSDVLPDMRRIRSPGASTASKMSQDVLSAAHGFRPSHSAQSYGLLVCFHSAGRVALISVTVVPSPTSVSSSLCSVRAYPAGTDCQP